MLGTDAIQCVNRENTFQTNFPLGHNKLLYNDHSLDNGSGM